VSVSKALLRLLRVRGLEEEQHKLALEAELARLHRAETELEMCKVRERRGRALLPGPDALDRASAAVEVDAARRRIAFLEHGRAESERNAAGLRDAFLEKRMERRQAETLIEGARASQELEARQRTQQQLDEWHASRREAGAGASGVDRHNSRNHEGNVNEPTQKRS
jgi:hypothetical protein